MTKTFEEIREILKESRSSSSINSESVRELWELAAEMDSSATEIFRGKESGYVLDFISMVEACTLTYFVTSGEMDIMEAVSLAQDEDVGRFVTMAIKLAIGFAAMEELR